MPTLPSGRKLLVLDALLMLWTLLWVLLGVVVAESVAELTRLTAAFGTVGQAIGAVGDVLGGIEVPILGAPLGSAGEAISGAGRDVSATGVGVREAIEQASLLIGAAVALAPTLPVLAAYAPARAARALEAAALRALLGAGRGDPDFESFLARRALQQVSYRRLRRIAPEPWNDDPSTRRRLAEEELRRLGLRTSALDAGGRGRGRPF